MPEVERRTGLSRSTVYRRIKAERFPGPVDEAGNIAAWRESDIDRWLKNRR